MDNRGVDQTAGENNNGREMEIRNKEEKTGQIGEIGAIRKSGKGCKGNIGIRIPEFITGEFATDNVAMDGNDINEALYYNSPPYLSERIEPIYAGYMLHKEETKDATPFQDPNDYFSIEEISRLINGDDYMHPYVMSDGSDISDNETYFDEETSDDVKYLMDAFAGKRASPVDSEDSGEEMLARKMATKALEKAGGTVDMAVKYIYSELFKNIQKGINGIAGPAVIGKGRKYYLEVNEERSEGSEEDMELIDTLANAFHNWSPNAILHRKKEFIRNCKTAVDGEGKPQQDITEKSHENVNGNDSGPQQSVDPGTASSSSPNKRAVLYGNPTYTARYAESASAVSISEQKQDLEDTEQQETSEDGIGKLEKYQKTRPRRFSHPFIQKHRNWSHGMKIPKDVFKTLVGTAESELNQKWGEAECWEKLYKPLAAKKDLMVALKKMKAPNKGDILKQMDKSKSKGDLPSGSSMRRRNSRDKTVEKFGLTGKNTRRSSLSKFKEEEDKNYGLYVHRKSLPSEAAFQKHRTPKEHYDVQDDFFPAATRKANRRRKSMPRFAESAVKDAIVEQLLSNLDDKRPKAL